MAQRKARAVDVGRTLRQRFDELCQNLGLAPSSPEVLALHSAVTAAEERLRRVTTAAQARARERKATPVAAPKRGNIARGRVLQRCVVKRPAARR